MQSSRELVHVPCTLLYRTLHPAQMKVHDDLQEAGCEGMMHVLPLSRVQVDSHDFRPYA